MEQELWYRWRELERARPERRVAPETGRANPGVIEQSRIAVGGALIRAGAAIAGLPDWAHPETSLARTLRTLRHVS